MSCYRLTPLTLYCCMCCRRLEGFPSPADMTSLVSMLTTATAGSSGSGSGSGSLSTLSRKLARFAGTMPILHRALSVLCLYQGASCLFITISKSFNSFAAGLHALTFSQREKIKTQVQQALTVAQVGGKAVAVMSRDDRLQVALALACIKNVTHDIHVSLLLPLSVITEGMYVVCTIIYTPRLQLEYSSQLLCFSDLSFSGIYLCPSFQSDEARVVSATNTQQLPLFAESSPRLAPGTCIGLTLLAAAGFVPCAADAATGAREGGGVVGCVQLSHHNLAILDIVKQVRCAALSVSLL